MKWLSACMIVTVCFVAIPAFAQQATTGSIASAPLLNSPAAMTPGNTASVDIHPFTTSGALQPTPEMWLYEKQIEEYTDAKLSMIRTARAKSAARFQRTEARKWYGISMARPTLNWTGPAMAHTPAYWTLYRPLPVVETVIVPVQTPLPLMSPVPVIAKQPTISIR